MLRTSNNMSLEGNMLLRAGVQELKRRLPPGWDLREQAVRGARVARERGWSSDTIVEVAAPDGRTAPLALEARAQLEPKGVAAIREARREASPGGPLVIIGRYLSEATRARLRDAEIGYVDLTGNARLVLASPGLYVETEGATEDPDRQERPARSLRGPKAGRIVRALIDRRTPPGVRELAAIAGVDPGYVSRVLAFLDAETLVTRVGHGRIEHVDWSALLRRWAEDAPLAGRGTRRAYLEPRGLPALAAKLRTLDERYVLSGSLAAAAIAPVAPARFAHVWVDDAAAVAAKLHLRPGAGANVALFEARSEGVFDGAVQRDGVAHAAPSQVAADLFTSPGRGPAEAEALLEWMQAHEGRWRK